MVASFDCGDATPVTDAAAGDTEPADGAPEAPPAAAGPLPPDAAAALALSKYCSALMRQLSSFGCGGMQARAMKLLSRSRASSAIMESAVA